MSNILTVKPPLSDQPKSGPISGDVFLISQHEVDVQVKDSKDGKCKEFEINLIGFIALKGKACLEPPSIKVCVNAFGFDLGCIQGDLGKGVTLSVNLLLIKGYLRFYLKEKEKQKCVWLEYDLTLTIGDINYHGD
ncbi:35852_t:CDS:1, partial [Racocetra persica]